MRNIDDNAPEDVLRLLVANKCDLHDRIVISTEHGKQLAGEFLVDYFETSAKSDSAERLSRMFNLIAEKLLDRRTPPTTATSSAVKLEQVNEEPNALYQKLTGCC